MTLATARPSLDLQNPAPGIYFDVPASEYHACPGASSSRLRTLARSPAHAKEEMDHPKPRTEAQIFGDAAHFAILQPHLFTTHYAVADQCHAILKSGPNKGDRCSADGRRCVNGEWFCSAHSKGIRADSDGRQVLSQTQYENCQWTRDSVYAHPAARELLDGAIQREVSFFWRDPATGVLCKGRADLLCGGGIIGDPKSTRDASPDGFAVSVYKFGYYVQGAMYLDGLSAVRQKFGEFRNIAFEKKPPFVTAVYRLTMEDLERGFEQLQSLLKTWKRCSESGDWPGYSSEVQDLALPTWARRSMDFAAAEEE